jgi:hypothetical protein
MWSRSVRLRVAAAVSLATACGGVAPEGLDGSEGVDTERGEATAPFGISVSPADNDLLFRCLEGLTWHPKQKIVHATPERHDAYRRFARVGSRLCIGEEGTPP